MSRWHLGLHLLGPVQGSADPAVPLVLSISDQMGTKSRYRPRAPPGTCSFPGISRYSVRDSNPPHRIMSQVVAPSRRGRLGWICAS
jgi:hypothetical protein